MDHTDPTAKLEISEGMRLLDASELVALGGGKNVLDRTIVHDISDTIQIFVNCLMWAMEEVMKPRC